MRSKRLLSGIVMAVCAAFAVPAMADLDAAAVASTHPPALLELGSVSDAADIEKPVLLEVSTVQPLEAVVLSANGLETPDGSAARPINEGAWPNGDGKVSYESKVTDNALVPFEVGWLGAAS